MKVQYNRILVGERGGGEGRRLFERGACLIVWPKGVAFKSTYWSVGAYLRKFC